jgi:adenosylmethionine-8-amino-7-oxononanoate aminotransferase
VRGRRHFIGVELVADRATRAPFSASLGLAARIGRAAAAAGLLVYPIGGNVDGVSGDAVILAPPFNASAAEFAEICGLFTSAVRTAVASLPAGAARG